MMASKASMMRKRGPMRNQRTRDAARNQLVAMYGRSCWLCGRGIAHGDTITFDHVTPLSKGGSNKIHNLRPAHDRCNRKRGNGGIPVLLLTPDMRLDRIISNSAERTCEPERCSANILVADHVCS